MSPDAIGNDYLAIGTVEKSAWKEGMKQQQSMDKMLPYASDFATYYEELQLTRAGYYKADQKPPIAVPQYLKSGLKSTLSKLRSMTDRSSIAGSAINIIAFVSLVKIFVQIYRE